MTFQRAMSYAFHDIKHVVEPYLDDLPVHSKQRDIHVDHLRVVFLRCHHVNIRLNPHKCVFCEMLDDFFALLFPKMESIYIP